MDRAWTIFGRLRRLHRCGAARLRAAPRTEAVAPHETGGRAAPAAFPASPQFFAEAVNRLRPAADTALGFAELLASRTGDGHGSPRHEDLQMLLDHCRAVSALLRDLGDLLRLGSGALQLHDQQVDAADLSEVAMRQCVSAAGRYDVTVTADLVEGIEILCDTHRLRQALEALVIHAMSNAGSSALRFALERSKSGDIAFVLQSGALPPAAAEAEMLLAGNLDRLGLDGLGPAVARCIALRHGGDVTIAPGRDGGTEFRLVLPAWRVTWPRGAGRAGILAA